MQKILLICHDIPSMSVGATIPIYHMIKNISDKYKIDLICFNSGKYDPDQLKGNLNSYKTLLIPEYKTFKDQLKYTLKNMLCADNLHTHSFLNYYYHKDMNQLIKSTIKENNYNLIITDMPMAFYVKNINLAKIVYAFDAVGDYNYQMYKKAENTPSKIYWYLNYLKIHNYERIYDKFNSCIVVNKKDKDLLKKDLRTDIYVAANGVDVDYFKNNSTKYEEKIVFLGDMSTPPNNDAVEYFVDKIYPKVLENKNIPFEIIGRNPTDYIKSLADYNSNITVTGEVCDVREYLTPGVIFITPMISGTGIKNKILEAMSMNLAVVSTSAGISGIDATDKKDFILADTPDKFAEAILELSQNKKLNRTISSNGREFVENNYSWQKTCDKLIEIIENTKMS